MSDLEGVQYGFKWGPLEVLRTMEFKGTHVVEIAPVNESTRKNAVTVYVSKTGRSVRVFRDGKELKVCDG